MPQEQSFKDAIGLSTQNAEQFSRVAAAFLADKDLALAEASAEIATQCEPSYAPGWLILGSALARKGDFKEAVPAYLRALELRPGDIAAWCNLGELYISLLDYPKAAQALKQAMTLDPKAEHPSGIRARIVVVNTLKMLKSKG